jgi:hypothetical protein
MLGFVGPAIAFVFSDFAQAIFLAALVLRFYNIGIKELQMWNKVFKLAAVACIYFPILLIGELFDVNEISEMIVLSICYFFIYITTIYFIRFEEIEHFCSHLKEKIKTNYA